MSALWLRKHLDGLPVRRHETNEPHFQPSTPCGVDATLTLIAQMKAERAELPPEVDSGPQLALVEAAGEAAA
jgi:hypothetical protein